MNLFNIEPQPDFPTEDLSDMNASFLELLLANREIFALAHNTAEQSSSLFRVGHRAIIASLAAHTQESRQVSAISSGTAIFEAISATVRLGNVPPAHNTRYAIDYFVNPEPTLDYLTLLSDVNDAFREEMPRTTTVIQESIPTEYRPYVGYALAGAALTRMAEIDIAQYNSCRGRAIVDRVHKAS
jgi:hypothetical protein